MPTCRQDVDAIERPSCSFLLCIGRIQPRSSNGHAICGCRIRQYSLTRLTITAAELAAASSCPLWQCFVKTRPLSPSFALLSSSLSLFPLLYSHTLKSSSACPEHCQPIPILFQTPTALNIRPHPAQCQSSLPQLGR
jgi:hypothetical protein